MVPVSAYSPLKAEPNDQPEIEPDFKQNIEPESEGFGSMPFLVHLEELRRRLIRALLGIILGAAVAFYFSDELIKFLKIPLKGVPLHNMQVTGAFYAYLKTSLIAGVGGYLDSDN